MTKWVEEDVQQAKYEKEKGKRGKNRGRALTVAKVERKEKCLFDLGSRCTYYDFSWKRIKTK